eukprot:850355-Rhodomonas_salina.2
MMSKPCLKSDGAVSCPQAVLRRLPANVRHREYMSNLSIYSAMRRWGAMRRLRTIKSCCDLLQSAVRRSTLLYNYLASKQSAVLLQAVLRSQQCRCSWIPTRDSALTIEASLRKTLTWLWHHDAILAAMRIQAMLRRERQREARSCIVQPSQSLKQRSGTRGSCQAALRDDLVQIETDGAASTCGINPTSAPPVRIQTSKGKHQRRAGARAVFCAEKEVSAPDPCSVSAAKLDAKRPHAVQERHGHALAVLARGLQGAERATAATAVAVLRNRTRGWPDRCIAAAGQTGSFCGCVGGGCARDHDS